MLAREIILSAKYVCMYENKSISYACQYNKNKEHVGCTQLQIEKIERYSKKLRMQNIHVRDRQVVETDNRVSRILIRCAQ